MVIRHSSTRMNSGKTGILAIACVVLLAAAAFAGETGKISGKVRNAKTGESLPSVSIRVVNTLLGAASDADGDYFISNLPTGTYSLRASIVGFREVVVTGVRVQGDKTTEQDIDLEETSVEVGEVVIVAKRPLIEKDNTASRTILASEEITSRPTASIAQVLTSLPSINYENGEMLVRGRPLSEVSVLVDGARARNPVTQSSYIQNVSLRAIEEMSVLTGSFSAEYGEAQTGVIVVTTKEGGEKYHGFLETRYTPPGIRHWGPSLYDRNNPIYWENTHSRHLEWWIEYPDQWTDPNGYAGNDPRSIWTAEQAYQNYLETHKPLTDYTNTPSYQFDFGFSGPVPGVDALRFFVTGNYQSLAPLMGNSFRSKGIIFNGTAKVSYALSNGMKFLFSGSYNKSETGWGITYPNSTPIEWRYAYNDYDGYPFFEDNAQSLKWIYGVDPVTLTEMEVSRRFTHDSKGILPGDPLGWIASGPTRDNVLAVDDEGIPVPGVNQMPIGFHTRGYFDRHNSKNTEWKLVGKLSRQMNKNWGLRAGIDATYYTLNQLTQAKSPPRTDRGVYHPYQGALYAENKLEFGGMILTAGLRFDFYSTNSDVFLDLFDPLNGPREKSKIYSQLSPRFGVAHPIDEKTVLHFSYGHFFQGPPYGDYGEMLGPDQRGTLTTFVSDDSNIPSTIGNRNLRPQKTVSYEVGIERNFLEDYIFGVTAYYQDKTNTIRGLTIETASGTTYYTNGNADYADEKGLEISLRKRPSDFYWGWINYTTRSGIVGKSGDPSSISPTRVRYQSGGDLIQQYDPTLKAALMLRSPGSTGFLGGIFDDLLLFVEYQMVFPNKDIIWNSFFAGGKSYLRPANQNTRARVTKELSFFNRGLVVTAYVEVDNVFNNKHLNLALFNSASDEDRSVFATSGFKTVPSRDAYGRPYLDMQKYLNLPRSIVFGASVEL